MNSEEMEKHVVAFNSSVTAEFASLWLITKHVNKDIQSEKRSGKCILPENQPYSRGSGSNECGIRSTFSVSMLNSDHLL